MLVSANPAGRFRTELRRRERQMKRFKSAGQAQRFLSTHDQINNLFPLCREHVTATEYRAARTRAFELWAEVSGVATAASGQQHPTLRDLRSTSDSPDGSG